MKEYIKKFESANAADNYPITDIPFICTVVSGGGANDVNLRCNEDGKKIVATGNTVVIEDAVNLITFTIIREATGDEWTFQCEQGMTWDDMANSEIYNPNELILRGTGDGYWNESNKMYNDGLCIYDSAKEYEKDGQVLVGGYVDPNDVIKPIQYLCYGAND